MSRAIFPALIAGLILATNQVHAEVIPPKGDDDQRVRVVFKPSDGGHAVPMFTPA